MKLRQARKILEAPATPWARRGFARAGFNFCPPRVAEALRVVHRWERRGERNKNTNL